MTDTWKGIEKFQKPAYDDTHFSLTLTLILKLTRGHVVTSGLLEAARILFLILGPQVLRHLIRAVEDARSPKWEGFEYCILLVFVGFMGALCETQTYFQLNSAGIKMKTAIISAVYRKSLKMLAPNGKKPPFWRFSSILSETSGSALNLLFTLPFPLTLLQRLML